MNENCLENFKCPQCGNTDEFSITLDEQKIVAVTDEGSEPEDSGEHAWEDDDACKCGNTSCGHEGTVLDFNFAHANAVVIVLEDGKVKSVHCTGGHDLDLTIVDLDMFDKSGQKDRVEHNLFAIRTAVTDEVFDEDDIDSLKESSFKELMESCSEVIEDVDGDVWDGEDLDEVEPELFVPIDFEAAVKARVTVPEEKPDPNDLP